MRSPGNGQSTSHLLDYCASSARDPIIATHLVTFSFRTKSQYTRWEVQTLRSTTLPYDAPLRTDAGSLYLVFLEHPLSLISSYRTSLLQLHGAGEGGRRWRDFPIVPNRPTMNRHGNHKIPSPTSRVSPRAKRQQKDQ